MNQSKLKKSKLTQAQLAELTNLSQTTVSTWALGKSVTPEVEQRIEKALKTKKKVGAKKLEPGRPRILKGEQIPVIFRVSNLDAERDQLEMKKHGFKSVAQLYRHIRETYYRG